MNQLMLQSTIAVSKLVSTLIGQSDAHLRRSLATIATYVTQDEKVQVYIILLYSYFIIWKFMHVYKVRVLIIAL